MFAKMTLFSPSVTTMGSRSAGSSSIVCHANLIFLGVALGYLGKDFSGDAFRGARTTSSPVPINGIGQHPQRDGGGRGHGSALHSVLYVVQLTLVEAGFERGTGRTGREMPRVPRCATSRSMGLRFSSSKSAPRSEFWCRNISPKHVLDEASGGVFLRGRRRHRAANFDAYVVVGIQRAGCTSFLHVMTCPGHAYAYHTHCTDWSGIKRSTR